MELKKNATTKDIKNMYYKLCFQYHPDQGSAANLEKFKRINEAYQVIGDEKLRKKYDEARDPQA